MKVRILMRMNEAAARIGVHPATLRRYIKQGRLHCTRTPGGQRIFTEQDIKDFQATYQPESQEPANEPRIAFYTRESDGNKTALQNQYKELKTHYGTPIKSYSDVASGLNENRKGLKKLLNDAKNNKYDILCITAKDRLTRFGYNYLEELLNQYGVTIQVVDDIKIKTPQEELLQDFMSLLASFSGKYYKLRSNEHKRDLLRKAEEELNK